MTEPQLARHLYSEKREMKQTLRALRETMKTIWKFNLAIEIDVRCLPVPGNVDDVLAKS